MEFEAELIDKLRGAKRIVFFTGAGTSQESGIPTFRTDDPNSIWKHFDPELFASLEGFDKQPSEVWQWYWARRRELQLLKPNTTHKLIAAWERFTPSVTVITQNIDNFHQSAGSSTLIELHGNLLMDKCRNNNHRFIHDFESSSPEQPVCSVCGSLLRPDVVWFGERLPEKPFMDAEKVSMDCDVFVSIGCSISVYPAAELPYKAVMNGAYLLQINPVPTTLDSLADCSLHDTAGKVLLELWDAVWGTL